MKRFTNILSGYNINHTIRTFSIDARPRKMELVPDVNNDLEKELYKPKHHPGTNKPTVISLPKSRIEAIQNSLSNLENYPVQQLVKNGKDHAQYLRSRQLPLEKAQLYKKKRNIKKEIMSKLKVPIYEVEKFDMDTANKMRNEVKYHVEIQLKAQVYNWQPIEYNKFKSFVYLVGRSAQEYAVLTRIFSEIAKRNPEFKPNSYFDFGSGVGTGVWAAADLWKKSLYEYYLVDSSTDMNDLADLILRDGNVNKHRNLKNVYFRNFLPSSSDTKYNIVVSAYSLNAFENQAKRLETVLTLWNKCDGYLVLVEQGTNSGFKILQQARDFLLDVIKKGDTGYVYAPCPHDDNCPRYVLRDGTPCNFATKYDPLQLSEGEPHKTELYSYVVFKKGNREDDLRNAWPRVVRPTLVRTQQAICKLCTARGQLESVIFTKSRHSMYTFRCGKKSDWGDRLPIVFKDIDPVKNDETSLADEIKE